MVPLSRSVEERFWEKVDIRGADECWPWKRGTSGKGYGLFRVSTTYRTSAHRVAYELTTGDRLGAREGDHTCHNPPCCNPAHIRPATSKQNKENRRSAQVNSKSGVRGVRQHVDGVRWRAEVRHNKKTIYLGIFDTIEQAGEAARIKREEVFTHF